MKKIIIIFIIVLLCALSWEYISTQNKIISLYISKPSNIYSYFVINKMRLVIDLIHTLSISLCGLFFSSVIGCFLAFLGLKYTSVKKYLFILSSIFQTIPLIVFVPFVILFFGQGYLSKCILSSMMPLFVVVISVLSSLEKSKKEYNDLVVLYKIQANDAFLRLLIPVSLVSVISSLRVSFGLSILGAIVAEFTGSSYGIGKNIFLASVRLEPELMVISILFCFLIGMFVHIFFSYLEHKYFWWNDIVIK